VVASGGSRESNPLQYSPEQGSLSVATFAMNFLASGKQNPMFSKQI